MQQFSDWVLFSLVALHLLITVGAANTPNVPASEINALYELYNATDGKHWDWSNATGIPWDFTATANPCKDNWQGIGCPLTPPLNVITITLASQNLRGTLPNAIGSFSQLQSLHIAHSRGLNGTLPDALGQLDQLRSLDISRNSISGSIPTAIGNLRNLETYLLYGNNLTGTVAEYVCDMTSLTGLSFSFNDLHGTIPACLGQLSNLYFALALSDNRLNGTIPASLGNLTNMHDLDLHANELSGTIPAALGNLTQLEYLFLFGNRLTGTIPTELGNLTRMIGMYAYNNALSGTLPRSFGNLSLLQTLDFNNNTLSGTFPNFLAALADLTDLSLYLNKFSGSLSDTLLDLSQLTYLEIYGNKISGRLPANIGVLGEMQYFEVSDNRFTGSLPASVVNLTNLLTLEAADNFLTGPIPTALGQLENLQFIVLNNNLLTGTITQSISTLHFLVELFLQNNRLTGSLDEVFDTTVQTTLQTVELSGNQLTGQLPEQAFLLHSLTTFAAVSNCFQTSLPAAICSLTGLQTLALDGLQTSRSCQDTILPGISASYLVADPLTGGVPSCLFQMPQLNTLHLSGNGLTGSLPYDLAVSPSLVDVSLSHNSLTGSIPHSMQQREWYNLDLSYNRLSGTLSGAFADSLLNDSATPVNAQQLPNAFNLSQTHMSVSLENNRLSGNIPGVLQQLVNVSILGSNLFSCNTAQTNLPTHDNGRNKYTCGSDGFDVPYYLWIALVGSALAVALIMRYGGAWYAETTQCIMKYVHTLDEPQAVGSLHSLRSLLNLFDCLTSLSMYSIAYICVILLPLYCITSYFYGTFTHQYAWAVSAAFLSGTTTAGLELAFLLAFLITFLCLARWLIARSQHTQLVAETMEVSAQRAVTASRTGELLSSAERAAVYALFMAVSFTVVIGVNVAYVYFALYQPSDLLLGVQILLSFFKLFWNKVCSTYLIRWSIDVISRRNEASEGMYGQEFMFVLLLVTLVNNIAIPCLVVAVVSPNCFYNLFVPAPTVHSTYIFYECDLINDLNGNCIYQQRTLGSTSYSPPFAYSYQCSSSFVTYYAPAFVFLCITATFLSPITQTFLLYGYNVADKGSTLARMCKVLLPKILRPIDATKEAKRSVYKPYFEANRFVVTLLTYVGILLTMGSVFPPLAATIAGTIFTQVYCTKIKLGRFLYAATEVQAHSYCTALDAECRGVGSLRVLQQSLWLIVTFSCWFYTLFLFDTLGDAVGFDGAYWVLIMMPLIPVLFYVTFNRNVHAWVRSIVATAVTKQGNAEESVDGTITMSPLAMPASVQS